MWEFHEQNQDNSASGLFSFRGPQIYQNFAHGMVHTQTWWSDYCRARNTLQEVADGADGCFQSPQLMSFFHQVCVWTMEFPHLHIMCLCKRPSCNFLSATSVVRLEGAGNLPISPLFGYDQHDFLTGKGEQHVSATINCGRSSSHQI